MLQRSPVLVFTIALFVIAVLIVGGLAVLVGSLSGGSSNAGDAELSTGAYTSIEEAQAAVGFHIPHARRLGAFQLESINVTGGGSKPDDASSLATRNAGLLASGAKGVAGTSWSISIVYTDAATKRAIIVSFRPGDSIAALDEAGTVQETKVGSHAAIAQHPAPGATVVQWVNGYIFTALSADSGASTTTSLDELLTLLNSID
jgi:hypothetical protein